MSLRADELIDRRRLRRKLTFWRVAALVVAAIAIGSAIWWSSRDALNMSAAHIARIKIEGTITDNEELLKRIKDATESDAVKGVIIAVNSAGGTTAGGEAIFEAVRKLAQAKPTVTQVGTLAASAGYMIASGSDFIVARQSSIIGSIGVLVQFPNVTGLLEKIGVTMDEVKSSPLKAEPSPFNPTTEEERAMLRRLIMDSYDWFVTLVTDRRPLDRAQVLALADGSVFTGRQALDKKLIDALGGEERAREWLTSKGVDKDLEVVEWKPKQSSAAFLLGSAGQAAARLLGYDMSGRGFLESIGADRIFLDGMLSLWHVENAAARD
ncbi:MAG: signal peptide peptidase SppA [Mesorhizobium sp.]